MSEVGRDTDDSVRSYQNQRNEDVYNSKGSGSPLTELKEQEYNTPGDHIREGKNEQIVWDAPGNDNEQDQVSQVQKNIGASTENHTTTKASKDELNVDEKEPPATPHATNRVRFHSDAKQESKHPRRRSLEDERSEQEKARRMKEPHLPSSPYSHERDIADIPLSERTDHDRGTSSEPPVERESETGLVGRLHTVLRTVHDKVTAVNRVIREKSAKTAGRLGRETHGGDDLTHAVYHPDWASGGGVPLSSHTDDEDDSDEKKREDQKTSRSEAHRLVRELTRGQPSRSHRPRGRPYQHGGGGSAGQPAETEVDRDLRYIVGGGSVLSQLMRLNGAQNQQVRDRSPSTSVSGTSRSGSATPKRDRPKWYRRQQYPQSVSASGTGTPSSDFLSAASKRQGKGPDRQATLEEEIRITVEIAEIIARQRYIMQLCKALMKFGAPTHRLEEYMQMSAKVLDVDSQYLYLPGCMIMAFDDPATRTTEMKLVRVSQGIDLGRLAKTHSVYKNVVHDIIGVEEAIHELEDIINRKPRYSKWIVVLTYGLATTAVGPFAFDARPIDMPIIFFNGCLLALMQHVLAPRSALYSNVFEVTASVLTSFIARAFGSIRASRDRTINGRPNYIFCFSAISQSSIALILPGFLVLTSSLELQSHQIVAGSIRLVYAIIYSLFLGYGITVGTTIYGLMDADATSETTCSKPSVDFFKSPYAQRFPFVAVMALFMIIINQGRWKQAPVMVTIALSGYVSNYFCIETLGTNSQVANTVGAFAIGVMGNLYSRLWHGHAATAILPGIFVLVPSGLAATGSLISGLESADEIRANVTRPRSANQSPGAGLSNQTTVFNLGFGMVQVAIGITIGLFVAALVIYPYGKRRSGLFSF